MSHTQGAIQEYPYHIEHEPVVTEQPVDFRRSKIQVLDRSALLLNILGRQSRPISLKSICEQSGLHPATCHRLLEALSAHEFVKRTQAPKGYVLVHKSCGSLIPGSGQFQITDAAAHSLRQLSASTMATVRLWFRDSQDLVCALEFKNGQSNSCTAHRSKLHTEAIGVHWLGHLGIYYVKQYIEVLNLETPQETVSFRALWSLASSSIAQGFAKHVSERDEGASIVGSLIRERSSLPVAAITIEGGPECASEQVIMRLLADAKHISDASFPD